MRSNIIPESELIINNEGAIYHLNLRPEELADTVITVGDPGRVEQVSRYFDKIEVKKSHREFITHTGTIGGKRISVLSTGIGPDNIDIALTELDALRHVDFNTRTLKEERHPLNIIRLGTSGSLQADIEVDSLVAASYGIGLDNLMHFYTMKSNYEEQIILSDFTKHVGLNDTVIHPYIVEGSVSLLHHFTEGYHHGITVTCPGFYAPQGRQIRLPLNFPHLIEMLPKFETGQHRISNFEMETSAIYGLSRCLGHHALSINTIVANRVSQTFSKDSTAAVDNMIRKSLEIIAMI